MPDTYLVDADRMERIREICELSTNTWCEVTGKRPENLSDATKSGRISLSRESLERTADAAGLDPAAILSGEIDFQALGAQQSGNVAVLPEAYSPAAFSKMRTSAHLLDVMEKKFGWRTRRVVLRKLQVTEAAVSQLDSSINIRFLTDLCTELSRLGIGRQELYRMGAYSVVKNFESPLGQLYRSLGSPADVFEICFTELIQKYYDRNHRYELIALTETGCTVIVRCEEIVTEGLRQRILGSPLTCATREGTFSSLAGYLMLPFATTRETRCIHHGDDHCRFEIDFHEAVDAHRIKT